MVTEEDKEYTRSSWILKRTLKQWQLHNSPLFMTLPMLFHVLFIKKIFITHVTRISSLNITVFNSSMSLEIMFPFRCKRTKLTVKRSDGNVNSISIKFAVLMYILHVSIEVPTGDCLLTFNT